MCWRRTNFGIKFIVVSERRERSAERHYMLGSFSV
jgi:hypothetical protein